MNFEIIRVLAAIIGTALLAYQDGKTSFMDERTLYAMLGIGILLEIASLDFNFALWSLLGVAIILGGGYFAYCAGQFGMGDVLLFAALHALLPIFPVGVMNQVTTILNLNLDLTLGLLLPPVFNILLISSILGLIGSSALYAYKLVKSKNKLKPDIKIALLSSLMCAVVFFLIISRGVSPALLIGLIVIFASMIFTFTFKDQVTNEVLITKLKINEIEDEDILAIENLDEKLVTKYKLEKVLTKSQVEILREIEKKESMHEFPVFKHLPRFGPYILLALILVLILGSPIIALLL